MAVEPTTPGIMPQGRDFLELFEPDVFQTFPRLVGHHPALSVPQIVGTPVRVGSAGVDLAIIFREFAILVNAKANDPRFRASCQAMPQAG